jgi:exopolysaccharide biosynthesis WecB/TagA/CpsF family protein
VRPIQHVLVGGVKAAKLSRVELANRIIEDCFERRDNPQTSSRLLFDTNGHGVSLAATDPAFARALETSDVDLADGGWIVLASRCRAGAPIPERSATTDLIHDLAARGLASGLTHFLLGSTEEVNAGCEARLRDLYPGIRIVGRHHGFFGDEEEGVIREIEVASPDILWIGLGKPREQLFAVRNRERLKARWAITCGGCFNYITGDYGRAPRWMQDNHIEWLYRAATTPNLIWRYFTTSPHAIWLALAKRDRRIV